MSHLLMGGHGDSHSHRGPVSSHRGSHQDTGPHGHNSPSTFSKRRTKRTNKKTNAHFDDEGDDISSGAEGENHHHGHHGHHRKGDKNSDDRNHTSRSKHNMNDGHHQPPLSIRNHPHLTDEHLGKEVDYYAASTPTHHITETQELLIPSKHSEHQKGVNGQNGASNDPLKTLKSLQNLSNQQRLHRAISATKAQVKFKREVSATPSSSSQQSQYKSIQFETQGSGMYSVNSVMNIPLPGGQNKNERLSSVSAQQQMRGLTMIHEDNDDEMGQTAEFHLHQMEHMNTNPVSRKLTRFPSSAKKNKHKDDKTLRRMSMVKNVPKVFTARGPLNKRCRTFCTDTCKRIKQFRLPLIRQHHRARTVWDVLIIVLAFWNCFTLPIDIAFEPDYTKSAVNQVFNHIIDFTFGLDILLNFRTTIANPLTGEEVMEPKVIAKMYMKKRFFVDIFASIPLDSIVSIIGRRNHFTQNLALLSMLKIIRLFRFTRIISYLNTTEDIKLSLKLIKMVFYLTIYLHWQACAWFFYTRLDQTWFPLLDIIKDELHFYHQSIGYKYCFSLWHSVSILDGADMVPANDHQAIVVSILVIISEFIHAHILGTIGVFLQQLNRKQARFQEQIEFATSTMKNAKLTEDIQHHILEYLSKKFNDMESLEDLDALMEMISPSLKHEVTQHMFLSTLKKINIFSENPDIIAYLVANIEALQFEPEEYIIKQGSKPTHMYILASGSGEVLVRDQHRKEVFVREIVPGDIFGEVALLFKTRRTASIKAKERCTVGALSADNFIDLLSTFPEVENWMRTETQKYNDHWKNYQINILSKVDYFAPLHFSIRETIHYRLTLENYEKGAKIFSRGHDCQNIFFIVSGEMELYIDQNNRDFELDTLIPGSIIGQYSLINESPYQYSGRAKTNLSILVLNRDDIFQAAEDFIELTEQIETATEFIIDFGTPWIDYKIAPTFGFSKQSSFSRIDEIPGVGFRDVGKIFKNAVRRVTVLNRSKELKVFKLFELINWIKAEKKRQQQLAQQGEVPQANPPGPTKVVGRKSSVQNLGSNFGSKRLSIRTGIPPVPPRKKSSQKLKISLDGLEGNVSSQALSETRGSGIYDGYHLGDNFYSQNSQSKFNFEFSKLNRRLDHITELLAGLTGDMSSVKVKLSIQRTQEIKTNLSTFGQAAKQANSTKELDKELLLPAQMLGEKRVSYQVQMSGIMEDEKENSSLNSSVSDTTPTTSVQQKPSPSPTIDKTKAQTQEAKPSIIKNPSQSGIASIFGGKKDIADVVKALQNQGTIANRVSALDLQMRNSIKTQNPRMSRISELGVSLKTSPFNSRQSSIDVSPKEVKQVPRSSVSPPPLSPKNLPKQFGSNTSVNVPILQIGKVLNQNLEQPSYNGPPVQPPKEAQDQSQSKPQLSQLDENALREDQVAQNTKSPAIVQVIAPSPKIHQPQDNSAIPVPPQPVQSPNPPAPQATSGQQQPLAKHINQLYIQQVMSLIQKKQAATVQSNPSLSTSPVASRMAQTQSPAQQLSNTIAQSIMRAASPSSSTGISQQNLIAQPPPQSLTTPQAQVQLTNQNKYRQLSEEQSSSFAGLQSATMQYLLRSGISGMLGQGDSSLPSHSEDRADDKEEEKQSPQGIFSGQSLYQTIVQGQQQAKNKTNFFRITNSRNQVQPAPLQQTVPELSQSVLEPANHRMTMSPRKNPHQDLTQYQPSSFAAPNQVHITLNPSQASSILTKVAQNLIINRNQSPPPPQLQQPHQVVQIDIESNSAKSTYNQAALLRKSRDKPPEIKPQIIPIQPQPFQNQMTPAFSKDNQKAQTDHNSQVPAQEEEEEEEEYDEESASGAQHVDSIIQQEIERMIEDGRRLEDENYDQGANDATRSDI